MAQATKRAVKEPGNMVARYGGEEFVIVLPNTDINRATAIAESIKQELRNCQIVHEESEVSQFVTISMGLNCQIPILSTDPKLIIGKADKALYMAKQQGRDRYCFIH